MRGSSVNESLDGIHSRRIGKNSPGGARAAQRQSKETEISPPRPVIPAFSANWRTRLEIGSARDKECATGGRLQGLLLLEFQLGVVFFHESLDLFGGRQEFIPLLFI